MHRMASRIHPGSPVTWYRCINAMITNNTAIINNKCCHSTVWYSDSFDGHALFNWSKYRNTITLVVIYKSNILYIYIYIYIYICACDYHAPPQKKIWRCPKMGYPKSSKNRQLMTMTPHITIQPMVSYDLVPFNPCKSLWFGGYTILRNTHTHIYIYNYSHDMSWTTKWGLTRIRNWLYTQYPYGGFHKSGYPQSSSILDWDFPWWTSERPGYPGLSGTPQKDGDKSL